MSGPYRLDRALVRVSGPDGAGFLQGLLTQDIGRLADAGVLYAALLSPQGKVYGDMFVWPDGDEVIIETDPARSAELLRRLTMFKLRANVTIEDITGQFHALYAPELFNGAQPDPRFPNGELGWREICPLPPQHSFPDGADVYDAHRIALGVPELTRDAAPDEVFALEALLEELNGVDFQKGCFVGQENVSRMKRRATTRRKFCPVAFVGPPPPFGAPVRAGEAELGAIRSGVNGRALALLRLDRALAARDAGETLTAEGRALRLEPPEWLLAPTG